jgi:hypothetical protein
VIIQCSKHPRYTAQRRPSSNCPACRILFILRWQHEKSAEQKLGGLNPFQFVDDGKNCTRDDTLALLRVTDECIRFLST